jgi:hypothetical protein
VIWAIWNMRNNMCFRGLCWSRMEVFAGELCRTNQVLSVLSNMEDAQVLEVGHRTWRKEAQSPPSAWDGAVCDFLFS